ncbi:hypothetical protein [Enterobacter roggenkampii]|uniref:hypothetical protein n=1 Tax=Enterobacter roggenkampii TaxID=1812935 RepID=UPI00084C8C8A|nr:hypothetical protein [Enterobacter roggenkampii]AOP98026.1 hypothetical protein BFV67_22910 [Enterobacter roggenkampii]QWZ75373.1 hypothetical protein I6L60_23045 [Enterobacter roggenkampii]
MDSPKKNTRSRNTDAPTTEELKSRFQARSLPLEKDFHDLIDVAECGRRAVGKNPGQTPNPDSGLMLDDSQQLVVKADVARGLAVSGSGVGVNTSAGNGLTVAGNQLKVALGGTPGLELTGTGLQVKADVARGLAVSGSGVGVNTSAGNGLTVAGNQLKVALGGTPGLELTGTGLQVKADVARGLAVSGSGVGVNTSAGNGLTVAGNQLKVALGGTPGLELTGTGLQVKADVARGLAVSGSGVGVNTSAGNGLTVAGNQLKVALGGTPGLELTGTGLQVKADVARGLSVSGSGVGVNTSAGNGLTVANSQLKVALGGTPGLELTGTGLQVKADVARGLAVSGSGVGVNIDTTLRFNNNQIGVPDNYVTKAGNSTIKNGSLSFETDNTGVHFYGGSKIIKASGSSMRWYKPSNNAMPQICDYDGSNPSNIATEKFAQMQAHIDSGYMTANGDVIAFEIHYWEWGWPIDVDFIFSLDYGNEGILVSGRACAYMGQGNLFEGMGISIDTSNSRGFIPRVVMLQNISTKALAIGLTISNNATVLRWRTRCNGGTHVSKAITSFSGYEIIQECKL